LLAAEGADEFAQAVLRVMNDDDLQVRLREAGLVYVRAFHNWSQIASELADIYQQVLDSRKSTC
jgi:glycosyltransferase involved in cell wall biosynthesis